jgi:hypothetical protein
VPDCGRLSEIRILTDKKSITDRFASSGTNGSLQRSIKTE